MAKRTCTPQEEPVSDGKKERARAAVDAVLQSIHDANRVLEGEDLVEAVYEVFGIVRPKTSYEKPK